ncbi:DEAD-box ATP-dependent RNA helicase 58, chloroplastic isoform X2 [Vicia villosa]|uniref:DEAD-box ATP-dependent RNA helicase 58, chloroplastic isoform X2 n=1 Tax=Vicia villosa TaxID=3911 RepID=UPI00273C8752|nr:DEAD-box ATP-dependent RNA helicase 58, chloroplastic isoform X2 [Vicia villosa]
MNTHTLSLSRLLPLRVLSSQNPNSSSRFPRSPNNYHFLNSLSSTHINRFSIFATTPLAIANPSPTIPTTDDSITNPTLRDLCQPHVPDQLLQRMEEVGYVMPTEVQKQALSHLFSGRDCILHAQAEPPAIVVATVESLCHMLERQLFSLGTLRVLVVDEVDFIFNSSKQASSLRKILTSYSSCNNRQTVFASASIPHHNRFLNEAVQQKWTKRDVIHIHVNAVEPMPSRLYHRFIVCDMKRKLQTLLSLIQSDAPESCIIFVGEQSEKSKKTGNAPSTSLVIDFLKTSYHGSLDIILLEDDMNFNSRAASLLEVRKGGGYLLVATDVAARGVDIPEMTHIYNFDLPKTAIDYLHRAGRTCRKPFSDVNCSVTSIIISEERFVLQRYENELRFVCEELIP